MKDKQKRYGPYSTLPLPDKPMNRVSPRTRARRVEADLVYGSHHKAIKKHFACELSGHPLHACGYFVDRPGIEGHHLKHVGTGGEDRNNQLPLCPVGHDEFHAQGSVSAACDFWRRDFKSRACDYTREIDRKGLADEFRPVESEEESQP